jgi:hypothetical protein
MRPDCAPWIRSRIDVVVSLNMLALSVSGAAVAPCAGREVVIAMPSRQGSHPSILTEGRIS